MFTFLRDETGNVRLDWLEMFLKQEKLPFELGWELRDIGMLRVLALAGEMKVQSIWTECKMCKKRNKSQ